MIRRPPRSTLSSSSAASDVYKRQIHRSRVDIRASTRASEGYPGPPTCCGPDQGGRALFLGALVSRVFGWRVCSFQPPPPRLAKSLCPHQDASGVLRHWFEMMDRIVWDCEM